MLRKILSNENINNVNENYICRPQIWGADCADLFDYLLFYIFPRSF